MRVIRVRYEGKAFYAALGDGVATCLNPALGYTEAIPLEQLEILPVVSPSKILCTGLNYKAHAAELDMKVPDEPLFFLKPPTSIIGPGQSIVIPSVSARVDHEAELALVIGRETRNVSPSDVGAHLFGYTCANDVTARDIQKHDPMFGRCKGFDTFLPIGPWIETEVNDPDNLTIRCLVNGEVKQEGHTSDMLHSPFELVSYISRVMTLIPGDVILTGTPPGVGPVTSGDEVRVEIETVGLLINSVQDENDLPVKNGLPVQ